MAVVVAAIVVAVAVAVRVAVVGVGVGDGEGGRGRGGGGEEEEAEAKVEVAVVIVDVVVVAVKSSSRSSIGSRGSDDNCGVVFVGLADTPIRCSWWMCHLFIIPFVAPNMTSIETVMLLCVTLDPSRQVSVSEPQIHVQFQDIPRQLPNLLNLRQNESTWPRLKS